MKKICLVIALAAMSLMVVPQVQAQDMAKVQQLSDEANRIDASAKARGGTFTAQEMQRLQQIQQEIMQAMGMAGQPVPNPQTVTPQQQPSQSQATGRLEQRTYPGATAGWPPASAFRQYGRTVTLPNLQTPHGITASYKTEGGKLIIYMFRNFNTSLTAGQQIDFTSEEKLIINNHFRQAFGAPLGKEWDDFFFVEDQTKTNTLPSRTSGAVPHHTIDFSFREVKSGKVSYTINTIPESEDALYLVVEIEPQTGMRRWGD